MVQPKLIQVKGGWHAKAPTWAVFGRTREEAIARFREAEMRHQEIDAREQPTLVL